MEAAWLASRLEEGRSIESIAREAGRAPSTVAYWVNKHGLASKHAPKHAARGGIARERLQALVEDGRSIRQIATELDLSATAVRHWLRKYGLRTRPSYSVPPGAANHDAILRECTRHGWTAWIRTRGGRYRCRRCRVDAVSARRRRVKQILVEEAGGRCHLCGYDRYAGALQFHHLDPATKAFPLSSRGLARSIDRARAEVAKCVLLCGNCHAEVEAGIASIPPTPRTDSAAR